MKHARGVLTRKNDTVREKKRLKYTNEPTSSGNIVVSIEVAGNAVWD